MKLRIRRNSLRFRLTKKEVETFSLTGEVSESVEFGGTEYQKMFYSLILTDKVAEPRTNFLDGHLSVLIPPKVADEWTRTDQVGFSGKQDLSEGKVLSILIEKRFCLFEKKTG